MGILILIDDAERQERMVVDDRRASATGVGGWKEGRTWEAASGMDFCVCFPER